jgi:hypothetical protein
MRARICLQTQAILLYRKHGKSQDIFAILVLLKKSSKKLLKKTSKKSRAFSTNYSALFCAFLAARKGHPPKSRR